MTHLGGTLRRHGGPIGVCARIPDSLIIGGSVWVLFVLSHAELTRQNHYIILALIAVLTFQLFSETTNLYRSYRGESPHVEMMAIWKTWGLSFLALLLVGFVAKRSTIYSRLVLTTWAFLVPLSLSLLRMIVRSALQSLRAMGHNSRTVAVVGVTETTSRVCHTIETTPEMGLNLVGVFADDCPVSDRDSGLDIQGDIASLISRAHAGEIDAVYVGLSLSETEAIDRLVRELSDTTADLHIVPSFAAFDLFRAPVSLLGDLPTLNIFDAPLSGVDGAFKRAEDIVLAVLALLLAALPMAVIAVLVKRTSHGPILFKQRRYGIGGNEIQVWKFRTMSVCEDGAEIRQASKTDCRVTPLGAYLRKTSLDELPQLFNVLRGHMSLVGPRPHAVAHNEEYRKLIQGYMLRHKVKPGITGLAQIRGFRGVTDTLEKMQERVDCDLEYIRNWSILLDFKILCLTLFVGFNHKNAY
ncbi:MAG: undecaprenyl-phosphate glucose phosphotransferase [Kiritimatiellia bacterium]|jgi:putative colanic acid biosynthesis UDP-glucose lipid carrier transferase|nr:undecaprenyl-phosphate glucose phosphotransferase [Kiritimatiellia bacterium]MDP6809653.1 undecaprenyl-phosphate glucose phosphotransferase [Kiritimatiellia bacterium]MDP7023497.1 undecaprenyl-phosphate glucose phosphotransferase [Kiritimatiellia bacterium]